MYMLLFFGVYDNLVKLIFEVYEYFGMECCFVVFGWIVDVYGVECG